MKKLDQVASSLIMILTAVCFSAAAQAEPIIGIGNAGTLSDPGILYSINPINGAVTALGPAGTSAAGFYPVSPSPVVGSYFALSPVNHYLLTYPQAGAVDSPGFALWDCSASSCPAAIWDFAYDSSNGKLFALTSGFNQFPAGLVLTKDSGSSFPNRPNSHVLEFSYVASSAPAGSFPALTLIEYIQGLGMYGTDGHYAYLIK